MKEDNITKKMLSTIREKNDSVAKKTQALVIEIKQNKPKNFLQEVRDIMDGFEKKNLNEDIGGSNVSNKEYVIKKNDPSFGDIRINQESELVKTIGQNIDLGEDALIYYPSSKDLVLNGKITSMNLAFQFRYNDPTGDGCYIWANSLQLTDTNSDNLGKIRSAFEAWKQVLLQDADLMEKLFKTATNS